jgi:nitrite reductase/ring-hydroxylating ferredoxin subunit
VAQGERLICAGSALPDGGCGLRFEVEWHGRREPAFVVRYRGRVHAYLNRCGHIPVELDWNEGEFFDISGLYLICAHARRLVFARYGSLRERPLQWPGLAGLGGGGA